MQINLSRINWTQLISYLAIVVLISMLFSKCGNESLQLATINALKTENATYKLKNGQLVTSAVVMNATNKLQAIALIGKDNELTEIAKKFTDVKTITKYKERIVIDTVNVVYRDSVPCIYEKLGSIKNTEFSLDYKSNQKGIDITNLQIENDVTIVTGAKRKWFLGSETQTIDITNSNKLVTNESLKHIEIKPKKRFYDTTLFKVAVGIATGIVIAK